MDSIFKFFKFKNIRFVVKEQSGKEVIIIEDELDNDIMNSIAKYYDYTIRVEGNNLILKLNEKKNDRFK